MKKIEKIVKDNEGRIYLPTFHNSVVNYLTGYVEVTSIIDKLNEVIEALNKLSKKSKKKKKVCIICGIELKNGKWIGKHKFPCANAQYGTFFTKEIIEI